MTSTLVLLLIILPIVSTQLLQNVMLVGEPRVIARRIFRSDLKTARSLAQVDDQPHDRRVNIVENPNGKGDGYMTGNEKVVTIYQRVLRPARLHFEGEPIVTDKWISDDNTELRSWNLGQRPTVEIGRIIQ